MPYKVKVETPLWVDHQRTKKAGKLAPGTEFVVAQGISDGGLYMLNVRGEVKCIDGHMDGGWVEYKNCEAAVPPYEPPAGEPPVVGKKKKYLITVEEIE